MAAAAATTTTEIIACSHLAFAFLCTSKYPYLLISCVHVLAGFCTFTSMICSEFSGPNQVDECLKNNNVVHPKY
jgi:hypothetical protein